MPSISQPWVPWRKAKCVGLRSKPQTFPFQRCKTQWENSRSFSDPKIHHTFFFARLLVVTELIARLLPSCGCHPSESWTSLQGKNISGQRFSSYFLLILCLPQPAFEFSLTFWPILTSLARHYHSPNPEVWGFGIPLRCSNLTAGWTWSIIKSWPDTKDTAKLRRAFGLSLSSKSSSFGFPTLFIKHNIFKRLSWLLLIICYRIGRPGMLGKGTCIFWWIDVLWWTERTWFTLGASKSLKSAPAEFSAMRAGMPTARRPSLLIAQKPQTTSEKCCNNATP